MGKQTYELDAIYEADPITDDSIGRRFPDDIDVGEALAIITFAACQLLWALLVRLPRWIYRKARR
jgi:hypothetical protein